MTAVHEPEGLRDATTEAPHDPERLHGMRVGLLSSIGDPVGFEATIQRLQATVAWHCAFPDHHRYQPSDWAAFLETVQQARPEAVLTTEKDWVRLQPITQRRTPLPVPLWVLGVHMTVHEGEEALDDRLAGLCAR